jgi:hypothetical protein
MHCPCNGGCTGHRKELEARRKRLQEHYIASQTENALGLLRGTQPPPSLARLPKGAADAPGKAAAKGKVAPPSPSSAAPAPLPSPSVAPLPNVAAMSLGNSGSGGSGGGAGGRAEGEKGVRGGQASPARLQSETELPPSYSVDAPASSHGPLASSKASAGAAVATAGRGAARGGGSGGSVPEKIGSLFGRRRSKAAPMMSKEAMAEIMPDNAYVCTSLKSPNVNSTNLVARTPSGCDPTRSDRSWDR